MDDDGHLPTERRSVAERARDFSRQARRFVHDRPLQAIALTIGVGFVLGKVFSGRHD